MKKVKKYKKIKANNSEKRLITAAEVKKAKRIRKINKLVNIILMLVVPIVLVFFSALIQRETFSEAINWMDSNRGIVVLNHIFILFVYFLIQLICARPWLASAISSFLYMSIPIISKLKFDIRGEVLLINDLALAGNFDEMAAFVEISDNIKLQMIFIFSFILFLAVFMGLKKHKVKRITSGVYTLLFLAIILISFVIPFSSQRILAKCGINNSVRFSPNIIHDKQGTWLGVYSNFVMNNIIEPFGYSKDRVYAILDNVKVNTEEKEDAFGDDIISDKVSEKKPNVIMIMSESFFDPTIIPGVKYSKDPIPNFRKLLETCESGKMITSTFGGGTSTIEFEAFTGETVEFLPYGTVPYTDLPKNLKNVQSIQRVFKDNGYHTIAIHDYDGTFYNRIEAYKNLGFDKFIESKDMEDVNYFGKYISDSTLINNIEGLIEKREDDSPLFIWGLTMQNHTPFQTSNYTKGFDRVKITSSNLSDEANDKLLAYVNGVYESDIQLKRLVDYLEKLDEPTILMFYGDHLPSIYEVYYETNMITTKVTTDWTKEEMLKMHTLDYFIYDNYSNRSVTHDNITGAVLLGNKLLNYAGIKKTKYFYFLDTLNYLALRDRLFVDANGKFFDSITLECNSKAQDHKMLEYDMIYGENYVSQYEKEH